MVQDNVTLVETPTLRFLLSAPPGESLDASGKWPVLCYLHGLIQGPPIDAFTGITAHSPLGPGSSSLASTEFIMVAPQLPSQGDIWRSYADAVIDVVSKLHHQYEGDPDRTYLTGFSFGGNGVFDLALHNRVFWAALWPVDPTRVPESDPDLPVWFSSGEASRPLGGQFRERLRLRLQDSDCDDRMYTDEGLDHFETATSAYRSDKVYQWLLSKRDGQARTH